MTLKQQFKSAFNRCITELNNNRQQYSEYLLALDKLEREYEQKYKQLLQGKIFVNVDNVVFLVDEVYLDTNTYITNNMPQIMTKMYVADCLDGFNYRADFLTGTLSEWYEDMSGKKVVQEIKCDEFLKNMLRKIIIDSYENKVRLRKRRNI